MPRRTARHKAAVGSSASAETSHGRRHRPVLHAVGVGVVVGVVVALGLTAPLSAMALPAPVGHAPVAYGESWMQWSGTTVTRSTSYFLQNDYDLDVADQGNLRMEIMSLPSHGMLIANKTGSYSYTGNATWNGFDFFSYRVLDLHGNASAAVPVKIEDRGFMPVNDLYTMTAGTSVDVSVADGVIRNDENPLHWSWVCCMVR